MVIKNIVSAAKALSDPHRVRALMALRGGELCVCQIIELLRLAPSSVSRHMTMLRNAGLVESRKDSRWVYYRLVHAEDGNDEITRLIDVFVSLLGQCPTIRDDEVRLKAISAAGTDASCETSGKGC